MGWISDQSHRFLFVITDESLQDFSLKLECVCKLSFCLSDEASEEAQIKIDRY